MLEKRKENRFVALIGIDGNIHEIKDNSQNKNISVLKLVRLANIYHKTLHDLKEENKALKLKLEEKY